MLININEFFINISVARGSEKSQLL